jgi:hypothetical protein
VEKIEVSNTLRKLRFKYDNINKLVKEKEKYLDDLKVYIYFPPITYLTNLLNLFVRKNLSMLERRSIIWRTKYLGRHHL